MKKSPFELLKETIESTQFDNALEMQRMMQQNGGESFDYTYFLAVKTVCELLLAKARYIYKHHKRPPF